MRFFPWLRANRYLALITLFAAYILVSDSVWALMNKTPPAGNCLQDLTPGINFYSDVKKNFKPDFNTPFYLSLKELFTPNFFGYIRDLFFIYPPLTPLSYAFFYFLFPPGSGMEVLANTLYLILAILALYGIGRRIFSEKVGLLAALIFPCFPGLISISREIYSEFMLMCLVVVTLYMLLRTRFFQDRYWSLWLGFCLGLLALTKWEFPLGIIGPCAFVLYLGRGDARRAWKNFLLAIALALLMAAFWYIPCAQDVLYRLFMRPDENLLANNATTFDKNTFSLTSLTYYPLAIINTFIRFAFACIFLFASVVSLPVVIKKKWSEKERFAAIFMSLWIMIPLCFLAFVKIQAPSHIMVILPPLALCAAAAICAIRLRLIRAALIAAVVVCCVVCRAHSFVIFPEFDNHFLNPKLILYDNGKFLVRDECCKPMRDCWQPLHFDPPDKRDWKIESVLDFVATDGFRGIDYKTTVFICGHDTYLNFASFQYYNLLHEYHLYIEPRGNDRSFIAEDRCDFDYIVFFDNAEGSGQEKVNDAFARTGNIMPCQRDLANVLLEKYREIKKYELPDKTNAIIYKKISDRW